MCSGRGTNSGPRRPRCGSPGLVGRAAEQAVGLCRGAVKATSGDSGVPSRSPATPPLPPPPATAEGGLPGKQTGPTLTRPRKQPTPGSQGQSSAARSQGKTPLLTPMLSHFWGGRVGERNPLTRKAALSPSSRANPHRHLPPLQRGDNHCSAPEGGSVLPRNHLLISRTRPVEGVNLALLACPSPCETASRFRQAPRGPHPAGHFQLPSATQPPVLARVQSPLFNWYF